MVALERTRVRFLYVVRKETSKEMAKKENRVMVVLACNECKRRNYNTFKEQTKNLGPAGTQQILPLVPCTRSRTGENQVPAGLRCKP